MLIFETMVLWAMAASYLAKIFVHEDVFSTMATASKLLNLPISPRYLPIGHPHLYTALPNLTTVLPQLHITLPTTLPRLVVIPPAVVVSDVLPVAAAPIVAAPTCGYYEAFIRTIAHPARLIWPLEDLLDVLLEVDSSGLSSKEFFKFIPLSESFPVWSAPVLAIPAAPAPYALHFYLQLWSQSPPAMTTDMIIYVPPVMEEDIWSRLREMAWTVFPSDASKLVLLFNGTVVTIFLLYARVGTAPFFRILTCISPLLPYLASTQVHPPKPFPASFVLTAIIVAKYYPEYLTTPNRPHRTFSRPRPDLVQDVHRGELTVAQAFIKENIEAHGYDRSRAFLVHVAALREIDAAELEETVTGLAEEQGEIIEALRWVSPAVLQDANLDQPALPQESTFTRLTTFLWVLTTIPVTSLRAAGFFFRRVILSLQQVVLSK